MDWNRWLCSLLLVLGAMLLGLTVVASLQAQTTTPASQADPDNAKQVALGQQVYASFCAGCHGANLEGQPNWRQRLPLGNFPAPPHDETGHTWHHADQGLFEVVKYGGKYHAPRAIVALAGLSRDALGCRELGCTGLYQKPLACRHPGAAGAAECAAALRESLSCAALFSPTLFCGVLVRGNSSQNRQDVVKICSP